MLLRASPVRLTVSALLLVCAAGGQPYASRAGTQAPPPAASAARVDRAALMRVVRTLADPALEGRRSGTAGNLVARRFIRDEFERIGLTPPDGGYTQPFTFMRSNSDGPGTRAAPVDAANVVGIVPGTRPARAIVVSAHYDHVGRRDGLVYPGADDNASGVAALLAVATHLKAHPPVHMVILAAFDAEEPGLEGAKAFLKAPPVPAPNLALNLNFDMVSRNDRNEIFAAGTYHTPSLKPIVDEVQRRSRVKILFGHDRPMGRGNAVEDWTLQSDHGVFHQAGIPFLYFGVEDHPDYHKPTDTADKIDPRFFGDVVEMLIDVVETADRTVR